MGYIVAIDQGTSATKGIVLDANAQIVRSARVEVGSAHPQPGWVEQDPAEILSSVKRALMELVVGLDGPVVSVGLSTQRESAVLWDRRSMQPVGPLIGWQDRRTLSIVERQRDRAADIERRTGLPLAPMFSASKYRWLLDHAEIDKRHLALGTVESWLVANLTGDHVAEFGNASRTMLLNLDRLEWDAELLDAFDIDTALLGELVASNATSGPICDLAGYVGVPIGAVLADSHAALRGHGVRAPGVVKVTYGTGSSVLGLVDTSDAQLPGLARTIAWHDGTARFAYEGNVISSGATLVWLARLLSSDPDRLLDLLANRDIAERIASSSIDIIPAFGGLGAPWWDPHAEAIMSGLTLGDEPADVVFAAAESIALQIEDVLAVADRISGRVSRIRVDGGPSGNDFLMQLQADISNRKIERSANGQLSAFGAGYLAGVGAGLWDDAPNDQPAACFDPTISDKLRARRHHRWATALERSRISNQGASNGS